MDSKPQISNSKRLFGLIGFPLSHSFSQKYFTEKFKKENIADCEFKVFPLENIESLPALLKENPTLGGLSVTIPHKQSVMKYLDDIDSAAQKIGAVNCIKIEALHPSPVLGEGPGVRSTGYNTDIVGFENSLKPLLKSHHTHALILGTGGAAKAVAYILDKTKIKFRLVSRNKNTFSYSQITEAIVHESTLMINTTPLGMFPNLNSCPDIPYQFLSSKHLLYDLTYNPEESLFLKKGKEKGAQIKNGLEMLHQQAEKAWEIWNHPT